MPEPCNDAIEIPVQLFIFSQFSEEKTEAIKKTIEPYNQCAKRLTF